VDYGVAKKSYSEKVPVYSRFGGWRIFTVAAGGGHKSFAALAGGSWPQVLAGLQVMSVAISANTESGSTAGYQSPMVIRFYELRD